MVNLVKKSTPRRKWKIVFVSATSPSFHHNQYNTQKTNEESCALYIMYLYYFTYNNCVF